MAFGVHSILSFVLCICLYFYHLSCRPTSKGETESPPFWARNAKRSWENRTMNRSTVGHALFSRVLCVKYRCFCACSLSISFSFLPWICAGAGKFSKREELPNGLPTIRWRKYTIILETYGVSSWVATAAHLAYVAWCDYLETASKTKTNTAMKVCTWASKSSAMAQVLSQLLICNVFFGGLNFRFWVSKEKAAHIIYTSPHQMKMICLATGRYTERATNDKPSQQLKTIYDHKVLLPHTS